MEFLQPLLDEFGDDYPDIPLLLRGDSEFTKPEIYHQCETNSNQVLLQAWNNGKLYQEKQEWFRFRISKQLVKNRKCKPFPDPCTGIQYI